MQPVDLTSDPPGLADERFDLYPRRPAIVYPDSDGKPMAENTLQFRWIVTIKEGLDRAFRSGATSSSLETCSGTRWKETRDLSRPGRLVAFGRPEG